MMPRLFLDTNVLLDVLLERPGYEAALDILQAVCAASAGCRIILTHNTRHFAIHRGLAYDWVQPEAMTPEAFLQTRPLTP